MNRPTLYGVNIKPEPDYGDDYGDDSHSHPSILITPALLPKEALNLGYTVPELVEAYRWAAGVMGRLGTRLSEVLTEKYRTHCYGRGCPHFYTHLIAGGLFDAVVAGPSTDLLGGVWYDYPNASFSVPSGREAGAVEIAESVLCRIYSDDLKALSPAVQLVRPEPHGLGTPAEPVTQPATTHQEHSI